MSFRPKFGSRLLTNEQEIFSENAWDNVEIDETEKKEILSKISKNSSIKLNEQQKDIFESSSTHNWEQFYQVHSNKFFKNRNWLKTEFPELFTAINNSNDLHLNMNVESNASSNETNDDAAHKFSGQSKLTIFEIGCGVGNTIWPIISEDIAKSTFVFGCDISQSAIEIVKQHELYSEEESCRAFVCDIAADDFDESDLPFPTGSLDIVVMIFVLSAIPPAKMPRVVRRVHRLLRPGGLVLFRDYGQLDLAQTRFKPGQCLLDNYYVRGDGTLTYFFGQTELEHLFLNAKPLPNNDAGETENEKERGEAASEGRREEEGGNPVFQLIESHVDKRMIVNRAKLCKMHRVWLQAKFQKCALRHSCTKTSFTSLP